MQDERLFLSIKRGSAGRRSVSMSIGFKWRRSRLRNKATASRSCGGARSVGMSIVLSINTGGEGRRSISLSIVGDAGRRSISLAQGETIWFRKEDTVDVAVVVDNGSIVLVAQGEVRF